MTKLKGFGSAALWSVVQTGARLVCSFVSIKVTAVFLGPSGLALTGQLGNFISLLQSSLGNGANTALVNLSAESRERDPGRAQAAVGTSLRVITFAGLLAAVVLLLAHRPIAAWLFGDPDYGPAVVLLALAFPAVLLGQTYLSLFSAERRFDLVSLSNVGGTLLGAACFIALCAAFGLKGGLAGTVLAYPMVFISGLWLGRRAPSTRLLAQWSAARKALVGDVARFYPMLLVHSAALPLATLLVRETLLHAVGTGPTGLWQSSARLSDMYTMIVITTLSMYSLPTLSAARDETEFRDVLARMVGLCLGLAALAAAVLFVARGLVIRLVFTHAFAPVAELWPWQLLGDVFMLGGWPMRSALTAQRRTYAYMSVEAGICAGLVTTTHLLVGRFGVVAANMAYAAVWATMFFVLLLLHMKTWRPQPALAAHAA